MSPRCAVVTRRQQIQPDQLAITCTSVAVRCTTIRALTDRNEKFSHCCRCSTDSATGVVILLPRYVFRITLLSLRLVIRSRTATVRLITSRMPSNLLNAFLLAPQRL